MRQGSVTSWMLATFIVRHGSKTIPTRRRQLWPDPSERSDNKTATVPPLLKTNGRCTRSPASSESVCIRKIIVLNICRNCPSVKIVKIALSVAILTQVSWRHYFLSVSLRRRKPASTPVNINGVILGWVSMFLHHNQRAASSHYIVEIS